MIFSSTGSGAILISFKIYEKTIQLFIMIRVKHKTLIILSGLVWLVVGSFLLRLGLQYIIDSAHDPFGTFLVLSFFSKWSGGMEEAALALIVFCLFVGFIKGRFILAKSVRRLSNRMMAFPEPTSILNMYSWKYCILLGSMIFLGGVMRYFDVSKDIRGAVDVVVGAALINGSMLYFRLARTRKHYS